MPVLGGGGTMPVMRSSGHDSGTFQAQKRRYRRVKDQHGRTFGFPVEGPDGHACGPIEWLSVGTTRRPPFLPPPAYLRLGTNAEGSVFLRVDYDGWKADVRRSWTDFVRSVRQEYSRINVECDWTPEGTVGMRGDVRDKVGPDPSPIEMVMACEQGNRWALYGEGTCPKALQKFVVPDRFTGSVLGSRETLSFEDEDSEAVGVGFEAMPVADEDEEQDRQADSLIDLDDEYEAKGLSGGVVPVKPKTEPKKASAKVPNAYQRHVKAAMQQGKTMAEAAKEWRAAHKQPQSALSE